METETINVVNSHCRCINRECGMREKKREGGQRSDMWLKCETYMSTIFHILDESHHAVTLKQLDKNELNYRRYMRCVWKIYSSVILIFVILASKCTQFSRNEEIISEYPSARTIAIYTQLSFFKNKRKCMLNIYTRVILFIFKAESNEYLASKYLF